jgi:hypothetical protein
MKTITFMTKFPATHPMKGQPTYFVEKILKSFDIRIDEIDLDSLNPNVDFKILDEVRKRIDENQLNFSRPKLHTIRAGHRFKVGEFFKPCIWYLPGSYYTKGNVQIQFFEPIVVAQTWDFDITSDQYISINGITAFGGTIINNLAMNDGLDSESLRQWFNKKPLNGQVICWNENLKY